LNKFLAAIHYISFIILFSSCGQLNSNLVKKSQSLIDTSSVVKKDVKTVAEESLISVIGVGDIMLGSNYPSPGSLPPDDGKYLLDSVKNVLQYADLTFGNLEGPFLNSGGLPKRCNTPDHCVSFRMPEHYAAYLKNAGFDVVSLANNHSNDMGDEGKLSTVKSLDKYSIKYAGYLSHPTAVFEKNGITFGFTAFAPNAGALDLNDLPGAVKIVSELKKKCDILIVSFHGGAEGYSAQRVTGKREIFLGEDRGNVYEFAHGVIDAGADIVFGHGPHVPRALELYKGKIIAYSLGNFCTYGKFSLSGPQGVAPLLKVYVDANGDFIKGRIYSFKQINRGFPVPDYDLNAVKIIRDLTEKDFPDTGLLIHDNGHIELSESEQMNQ
jgi:poly-gamma-glutamate capsule biosynthesis protein CapA/YwtB (metallophosphatase superfamily)